MLTIEQLPFTPIRYRRIVKLIPIAALLIAAPVFLAAIGAQQAPPRAPDHSMPMSQAGGMMDHDQMMADMKAATCIVTWQR